MAWEERLESKLESGAQGASQRMDAKEPRLWAELGVETELDEQRDEQGAGHRTLELGAPRHTAMGDRCARMEQK